jgi:predicted MFS family arabinose efflux permease
MSKSAPEGYSLAFFLTLAANLFFFSSFQWTFATLPGYVLYLGGGPAQIGLAFGLFTLSAVLVRPLVGLAVDRWQCKGMLWGGATIFVLSPVLYVLSRSTGSFLAVRLLHGLGIAAFTTAYTALVVKLAPPGRRGEAVGLSGVTNNLGMLFAPALGVLVLERWGYTIHFLASAGMAALSLLTLLAVSEPRGARAVRAVTPGFWATARLQPVWAAALASTGLAVAYGAVLSFLAPFAAERNLTATGTYFTFLAAAMMAAQATAGWLSDRVGRRAVAIPGLLLAAASIAGLGMASTEAAMLASGAGLGLSWGLVRASLDTAVVDAVSVGTQGTALGFLYTCFDLGIGVGSVGLGIVAQGQGFAAAFYWAAAWALLALGGFLRWGRQRSS